MAAAERLAYVPDVELTLVADGDPVGGRCIHQLRIPSFPGGEASARLRMLVTSISDGPPEVATSDGVFRKTRGCGPAALLPCLGARVCPPEMNHFQLLDAIRTVLYDDLLRRVLKRLNLYLRGRWLLKAAFSGISALYTWEDEFEALGTAVRYRVRTADDIFQSYFNLPSERPVVVDVLERLEDGDVIYDVGAGTGIIACLLANSASETDVYAFEPSSSRIDRIREHGQLNGCDVDVLPVALSDESGDATVRGDELVQRGAIPPPDVVKIDVDGHELAVVEGLLETLSDGECRLVYCELHPFAFEDFESVVSRLLGALDERGFDVEQIHQRADQPFLRAEKHQP